MVRRSTKRKKPKKSRSKGLFIWLGLILAVGVGFVSGRQRSWDALSQWLFSLPGVWQKQEVPPTGTPSVADESPVQQVPVQQVPVQQVPVQQVPVQQVPVQQVPVQQIVVQLYFVEALADGAQARLIPVPETFTAGPNMRQHVLERLMTPREGVLSMLPVQARLLSQTLDGRILRVDFSEGFTQNTYGTLGAQLQIYQIVYTMTQFDEVDAVSFFVNGQRLKYLGGNGYTIDNPVYPFSSLPEFPL